VEDENYRISPRAARGAAFDDDEDEDIEDKPMRQVEHGDEEGEGIKRIANLQQRGRVPFSCKPTIRKPHKPLRYNAICYRGKGTTKEVKRLQKIDPRPQLKGASDYRFHTHFQYDLYETVIMLRRRIVSEAQWMDWNHMAEQQDPIFNQVIATYESCHIKKIMSFHYNWNIEVIAQFYAILFIEDAENVRAMHWMMEGEWFHITFDEFATQLSYGQVDKDHIRTHIHNPLDENEMKFMYAPGQEENAGTINGLYTFYSVLKRLFRKTICPRDGYPTNISQNAKNLLANMRDGAPLFSVMDFVWEEIKGISMNPKRLADLHHISCS
jgi:hypothetical protein